MLHLKDRISEDLYTLDTSRNYQVPSQSHLALLKSLYREKGKVIECVAMVLDWLLLLLELCEGEGLAIQA